MRNILYRGNTVFTGEKIIQKFGMSVQDGMIADIGYPDFETRVAILQKKLIEK